MTWLSPKVYLQISCCKKQIFPANLHPPSFEARLNQELSSVPSASIALHGLSMVLDGRPPIDDRGFFCSFPDCLLSPASSS